ncbi:MAG: hypothetical protein MJZ90_10270 [Bacteroidales bacterium]|nr:hypothetical protein [Bacteroidales bacterium]
MKGSYLTILTALLLAIFESSCRQVQQVTKTEYRYIVQHDSIWRDCTDTILIEKSGDTVRIFEKKTEKEYYYTYFRDTLRLSDTLRIERTTVKIEQPKKSGKIKTAILSFIIGVVGAIFFIFAIKFYQVLKK